MSSRFAEKGRYAARGASSQKSEVHAAIAKLDKGLFPSAFCKVTSDVLTGDPKRCNLIHADGAGTKAIVAYLAYRETGDPRVFRGIAQDSLVMNLDDLICVGATDRILFSNTVNRNARNIPGEVLAELIGGTEAFLQKMRDAGVGVVGGGGETADVADLTGTIVVDSTAAAVMRRDRVVSGDKIAPGLAIVGLASDGVCAYDRKPNSGIASNGLTSARHDLLCAYYRKKYPEACDPKLSKKLCYCGPYRLEDALPDSKLTVGAALLSPTRTYAPVVARLLKEMFGEIRGLVHCSGGAQTKCLRFGHNVRFVKDNLFPTPPVFAAIQKASGTTWEEMYRVYNMGHRMEIYVAPKRADDVLAVAKAFGMRARIVGHTEPSLDPKGRNHLSLVSAAAGRTLEYGPVA